MKCSKFGLTDIYRCSISLMNWYVCHYVMASSVSCYMFWLTVYFVRDDYSYSYILFLFPGLSFPSLLFKSTCDQWKLIFFFCITQSCGTQVGWVPLIVGVRWLEGPPLGGQPQRLGHKMCGQALSRKTLEAWFYVWIKPEGECGKCPLVPSVPQEHPSQLLDAGLEARASGSSGECVPSNSNEVVGLFLLHWARGWGHGEL